jgi:drug/metabolite transporter (DMT)-like permease
VVAVVALAVAEQAATSLVGPLTGQFYALLTSVNDDHHQQRGAGWPPLSFVGFLAHAAAVLLLVASLRALAQVQPPRRRAFLVLLLLAHFCYYALLFP